MAAKQTIVINGKHYDTQSGLPVDAPIADTPKARAKTGTMATGVHNPLQKSQTLNRKFVHKTTNTHPTAPRPSSGPKHMDISRNSSISRFAPHPVVRPAVESDMVISMTHPMVQKAHQSVQKKQPVQPTHTPASILKNEAIAKNAPY